MTPKNSIIEKCSYRNIFKQLLMWVQMHFFINILDNTIGRPHNYYSIILK